MAQKLQSSRLESSEQEKGGKDGNGEVGRASQMPQDSAG